MRNILVILNPAARGARAQAQYEQIRQLPGKHTLTLTEGPGDAREIASRAAERGYDVVVAAGGDGTINEVVNGLGGAEVALGVLPVGTMNVFAAELGLPTKLLEAWQVIREGHTRAVDLPRANEQHFVQLAGVGLDAQAVKETPWDLKKSLGPLSYLFSAAQIMARKPPRLVVEADGRTEEGSFVLVGNGRFYGGRLTFFKEALVDDGQLEVLVFQKVGHLDIAWYMAHILMGQYPPHSDMVHLKAKRVRVSSEQEVPVEVDGELAGFTTPVDFSIHPQQLRVIVPQALD